MINYGVILDRSISISGNSLINNNVEGCEAHQKQKLLFLMQSGAKANPNLLINTTRLSLHAATVGRINEIIFYMQSRGLSEETAKTLIVKVT